MEKLLQKNKMTISEGLAKLKLLDKRIRKSMAMDYIGYKVGNKIQDKFNPESTKGDFQSIKDLIDYRTKLKTAINISNMKTKVKVAGKKLTVLEAIEYKQVIDYQKQWIQYISQSFRKVNEKIEYGNAETQERLDQQVRSAFEKATKKEIEQFTETFLKNNGYTLEDPLDIENVIKELDKSVDEFESEVDFVLSTSNATTIIEV